jgi:adenylate cyclase
MYRLTYQDGDQPKTFSFSPDDGEVVIGRAAENKLVLTNYSISRRHAKLVADGDTCHISDLDSKNGTHVNGVQIKEAVLKDGDRVLFGNFPAVFNRTLEDKVVLDEDRPLSEEAGTIIRSVGELSKLLARSDTADAARRAGDTTRGVAEVREIEKSNRILRVLTEVAKTLIAVRPVKDVLQQVMDIVFEYVNADRGFLMLYDEAEERLLPMVVRHRKAGPDGEQPKIAISKTIADKVFKDRVSILTHDAMIDDRLAMGQSIILHSIRSAMCAPLWNQDQIIGIIHVDTPFRANAFTEDDLDLLTALAHYAAVAVDRSRLQQKIVAEERKRERLGRFLSPQVTNRIIATSESQDITLGIPEDREVSVLFADIVGFTRMSERMGPAAVSLLLNDYLSRMTDVIFRHEGTLDKYIGDAIMAVFGAPLDMPDHPERAVRAALEMREKLEEFNAQRPEGPLLQVRVGINSGRAVAGEIGSVNKMEYTVLGDTVNTASRLESSVATPGSVVIGENTYGRVKDQFRIRPLGKKALKGKELEVAAYEVEGYLDPLEPTAAAGSGA